MAINKNQFRAKLVGGGARANLFEVVMTAPAYAGLNVEQFTFMCKAASQPTSQINKVELPYMGSKVNFGGNRTFEDWNVTIINDESHDIRNAMERWNSGIASHSTSNNSVRGLGATANPNSYVGTATVNQLSKLNGTVVKSYKMINIFPITVAAIDLNWETNDQIEEFQVTFAFDYFTSANIV